MTTKNKLTFGCPRAWQNQLGANSGIGTGLALTLSGILYFSAVARLRAAENRADYRYEDYAEDGGRIHIQTHGAYLDVAPKSWVSIKANYIYDAISGATPTGAPPVEGTREVAKATIDDIRHAGFVESALRLNNHTFSPQVAYSRESDYESVGVSLSHAIELNDKNTTLSWGISHSFDHVLPNEGESISTRQAKDSTDVLVGINQLLNPHTIVSLNLTLGYSDGYLSDPYKRVVFNDFPHNPGQPYTVWPEKRPGHKFRQVVFASFQHSFEPVRGALAADYRFHHDDFGVVANTVTVEWHQKLGEHLVLSPLFRYHTQTAADFYGTGFPGDPSLETPLPDYYTADYRASALDSFTYGVQLSAHVHEHVSLDFAYKRYVMQGTDGVTAGDQYPQAHVFTGGLTVWF